jgi:hypothetical protein
MVYLAAGPRVFVGDPVKQLLLELQAMAAPFRTGTHVFTTHDGERMVYYTLGDPANPTVLLLHGCTYRGPISRSAIRLQSVCLLLQLGQRRRPESD